MGAQWPAIDMEAEFPCLSHRFLFCVVSIFAEGPPVASLMADLYGDATTDLIVNWYVNNGFPISAGVHQGCLASGSIFALAFHTRIVELATVDYVDGARVDFDVELSRLPMIWRSALQFVGVDQRRQPDIGLFRDAVRVAGQAGQDHAIAPPGGCRVRRSPPPSARGMACLGDRRFGQLGMLPRRDVGAAGDAE